MSVFLPDLLRGIDAVVQPRGGPITSAALNGLLRTMAQAPSEVRVVAGGRQHAAVCTRRGYQQFSQYAIGHALDNSLSS